MSRADAGPLALEIIDVPNGYHGFDNSEAGPDSVAAIEHALNRAAAVSS